MHTLEYKLNLAIFVS